MNLVESFFKIDEGYKVNETTAEMLKMLNEKERILFLIQLIKFWTGKVNLFNDFVYIPNSWIIGVINYDYGYGLHNETLWTFQIDSKESWNRIENIFGGLFHFISLPFVNLCVNKNKINAVFKLRDLVAYSEGKFKPSFFTQKEQLENEFKSKIIFLWYIRYTINPNISMDEIIKEALD